MDPAFRELLADFLSEAAERIDAVEQQLLALSDASNEARDEAIVQIKRDLHTVKGNAGMMGFADIQALAHALEDQVATYDPGNDADLGDWVDATLGAVDEIRATLRGLAHGDTSASAAADTASESDTATSDRAMPGTASATQDGRKTADNRAQDDDRQLETLAALSASDGRVRVPYAKIDELVELQAEALVLRNRLSKAIDDSRGTHARDDEVWQRIAQTYESLEKSLDLMQDRIIDLGMVPLEGLFRSLSRIVHDESRGEGKHVRLVVSGGDTPIDKALLEVAAEALGHLIRNAVIHGIESPDERAALEKPQEGTVSLDAEVVSSEVHIRVHDDGAGIDLDTLARKATEALDSSAIGQQYDDPLAIVFEAGISSRRDASMSAGRGVGLSAVKASVERVGGQVQVTSEPGNGATFTLRLPLTTTILRSLLLDTDGETYALPLGSVVESLHLDRSMIHNVNHSGMLRWRGKVIPLLDLGAAFETADLMRESGFAVVIATGGRNRALVVDNIAGIRDIVVKGLDPIVGSPVGISGSTILGDGRVIMILDPVTLVTVPPTAAPASPSVSPPSSSRSGQSETRP